MKSAFIAILLVLWVATIQADEVKTFSWTPPTAYMNGQPLTDLDISEYRIYCNDSEFVVVPNLGNTSSWSSGLLSVGDYSCYVTVVDVNGVESGGSNIVNFSVAPSVPNPPTGFTVK